MLISVIIPTYKRNIDLIECLDSILNQIFLPKEILIIDNAKDFKTKEAVLSKRNNFIEKGIELKYFENKKENSLTSARNLGVKLSDGDVVSFLDDDVVLDKNYFKEINNFFLKNPEAIGVSGKPIGNLYEKNKLKFIFAQIIGKVFFLGFNEENKGRVLPSLGVTSPMGEETVAVEWLSGASSSSSSKIFKEFFYDENLKKYSWSEDLDFSYRVYKKYPGTLFFNPKVRYLHKLSESGRTMGKEKAFMEEVYNLYLFYKLIPQNFKNKLIYIWSRIGTIIYKLLKFRFKDIYFSFLATIFCIKNLQNIKTGNLEFFNKTLK
jgi:GT2 family glycosyltransferase